MHKIFLLTNLTGAGHGETRGMILVAPSSTLARHLATITAHSHNNEPSNGYGDEGREVWEDSLKSSCIEVGRALPGQEMGILLTDFIYD